VGCAAQMVGEFVGSSARTISGGQRSGTWSGRVSRSMDLAGSSPVARSMGGDYGTAGSSYVSPATRVTTAPGACYGGAARIHR
jgi:hypothetical protein